MATANVSRKCELTDFVLRLIGITHDSVEGISWLNQDKERLPCAFVWSHLATYCLPCLDMSIFNVSTFNNERNRTVALSALCPRFVAADIALLVASLNILLRHSLHIGVDTNQNFGSAMIACMNVLSF